MRSAAPSSPLLVAGLLWGGLTLSINAPAWLHCALGMLDRGCARAIPWQAAQVGATVGGMMLCAALGMRLLPRAPRWRLVALSLLDIVAALVGLLCTATVLMIWRGPDIGYPSLYTLQILLTQSVCMVAAYEYMGRARNHHSSAAQLDLQQQQLAQQIDAARLQLLQAQVEPHFLFNTLAHLRRLAQTDPVEARAMLGDLLAYLSEALPELREAQSTLERELRLVRAYLGLHQRRMGETRLRMHFDIEPGLERALLPGTALLTLSENAIKHGLAPLVTGGSVRISARREGEQLLLEHADTGRGMGTSSGHGTGLATLRARLKALYGEAGGLSLQVNQPRGLIVTLRLPLRLAPMTQALQLLWRSLQAWSWSHTRWALFVGAATLFANGTPLSNPGVSIQVWNALTYNILQFGFPLVLLLGWAHRLVDAGLLRAGIAYPLVVLVEVPAGVLLIGPALMPLLGSVSWWTVWNDVVLIFSTLAWHGLGVAVVAQRHLSQRAEERRLAAERAHAERQRELAATELLVLQARVDPLLFERLQTIGIELVEQPAQARRRLEALIDLLRALQPHAQARVSTLGREIDALEAYARLGSREVKGPERLLIHLPEAMRELAMAPLVLLPLLRPLLAAPGLIWQLSGETRPDGMALLRLAGLGPGPTELRAAAGRVDLAELRHRLLAVLGPGTTLELDEDNLPCFTLQWPPHAS